MITADGGGTVPSPTLSVLDCLTPPSVIGVSRIGSGSHLMSFVLMERESARCGASTAVSGRTTPLHRPEPESHWEESEKRDVRAVLPVHQPSAEAGSPVGHHGGMQKEESEERAPSTKATSCSATASETTGPIDDPARGRSLEGPPGSESGASLRATPREVEVKTTGCEFGVPVDHAGLRFRICHNFAALRRAVTSSPPAASCFMWETSMTQPFVDSGELRRLSTIDTPWPAFVVVARREWLSHNRKALQTAMGVLYGLCADALDDRNAHDTQAKLSERFHLSPSEARRWMGRVKFAERLELPRSALTLAASALQRVGVLPESHAQGVLSPTDIAESVVDHAALVLTD